MRLIKILLVLTLAFLLLFTAAVYAEPSEGWEGYGLYNINGSKISIISEDISIKLQEGRLIYEGEFLIRNYSNAAEKATLGMPSSGIEKLVIKDKTSAIKSRQRSFGSLRNEFDIDNQLPQEDNWNVFGLNINPGETKLLNIQFEGIPQKDERGSYVLTYYNDRKLGFSNNVEKSSLYIDISDFQPYNLLASQGVDPAFIGVKGDIVLKASEENISTVFLQYADISKAALDRLMASPMYKPREIALAFNSMNYSKTSALCDEYIKNPSDSQISQEQMLFIKAECLRRLQSYEKYLEIVEALDYTKLAPATLKSKIFYDRVTVYLEQGNQQKLAGIYKEMEQDASESTALLRSWIMSSSMYGASQINQDNVFKQIKQDDNKTIQSASLYEQWYQAALEYKYTPIILFGSGLIIGLLLRGLNSKKRKRRSKYIYRM